MRIISGRATGPAAHVARAALSVLAGFYRVGWTTRRAAYALGLARARGVGARVVSVGNVTAGRHATLTAGGNVSGDVTATTGNASVTVADPQAALSGNVTAGIDAAALSLGSLTGSVSAAQDATASAWGALESTVQAGRHASAEREAVLAPRTGSE